MPLFTIPSLSIATYHDGAPVMPGDTAVPILMVVDGNNKTTFARGDPVAIRDLEAPVVAGFGVTQDGAGYTFTPSSGTVKDDTRETVHVYHVIALTTQSLTPAALLALVQNGAHAGSFGYATISPNTPRQEVALSGLTGLGTNKVYDGASFRDITHGDSVRSYLLATNPSTNVDNAETLASSATQAKGVVTDHTPPAFSSGPTVSSTNETSATVSWTLADAGDAAASAATPLYIGLYTSNASPPSAQDVVDGVGTGFVRRIDIADGKATSNEVIGDASPVSDIALSPATSYYLYVVAEDSAGNRTARQDLVATTTDATTPGGLSSVTVTLGTNDATTEVLVSGLQSVVDNDELATLSVKYCTVNNADDAGTTTVSIALSGGTAASDTQLVTGLSPGTLYYFWTRATDPSGNDSGAVSTTPGSATTDAPTGLYPTLDDWPVSAPSAPLTTWLNTNFDVVNSGGTAAFTNPSNTITGTTLTTATSPNDMIRLNDVPSPTGFVAACRFSTTSTSGLVYLNPVFAGGTADYAMFVVRFNTGVIEGMTLAGNFSPAGRFVTTASVFSDTHTIFILHDGTDLTYTIFDGANAVVETITVPAFRTTFTSGLDARMYFTSLNAPVTLSQLNIVNYP